MEDSSKLGPLEVNLKHAMRCTCDIEIADYCCYFFSAGQMLSSIILDNSCKFRQYLESDLVSKANTVTGMNMRDQIDRLAVFCLKPDNGLVSLTRVSQVLDLANKITIGRQPQTIWSDRKKNGVARQMMMRMMAGYGANGCINGLSARSDCSLQQVAAPDKSGDKPVFRITVDITWYALLLNNALLDDNNFI